jgi:hypothetical protein
MKDRTGRGAKPRVRPQMNTDTRRHAEKSSYHRKSKYKEDLLDDEDLVAKDENEDGGVLSDYVDDESPDERDDDSERPPRSSGRR